MHTVISNEYRGYDKLKNTNFIDLKIDHIKMFCDVDIHTNTIESFDSSFDLVLKNVIIS